MRAKCFFWPCASIAPSLGSRVESGSEKTTIENRQKGNEVTELAEITNDGMNRKGMGLSYTTGANVTMTTGAGGYLMFTMPLEVAADAIILRA